MSHRFWKTITISTFLFSSANAQQALHCGDLSPTVPFDAIRAFECISRTDALLTMALDRISGLENALQELQSIVASIDVNAPSQQLGLRLDSLEEVVVGLNFVPAGGNDPNTKAIVAYFSDKGEKTCPEDWSPYELAKDRFIVGAGGNYTTVGSIGGAETVTLTIDEMPSHDHAFSGSAMQLGGLDLTTAYGPYPALGKGTTSISTVTPAGNISASGGSQPHNNMPPYIALYFCKKN